MEPSQLEGNQNPALAILDEKQHARTVCMRVIFVQFQSKGSEQLLRSRTPKGKPRSFSMPSILPWQHQANLVIMFNSTANAIKHRPSFGPAYHMSV